MSTFKRACVLLLVIIAAACAKSTPNGPTSGTRIIGLSGNLAFGSVTVGQEATARLTIANSGNATLTVTGITVSSGSGGAFTANWTDGPIAAGASQQVTIYYHPATAQNYSGTLVVNGDQTGGNNTIGVSGIATDVALTVAEIAPTLAKTLTSAIVWALESSASASNMSTSRSVLARVFDLILPPTLHAMTFSAACPTGGNVSISGVGSSGSRYSFSSSQATFTNCEWNADRAAALANGAMSVRAVANGAINVSGVWCPGQGSCNGLGRPVNVAGNVTVTGPGVVPVNGSIGLTDYSVSIGGAGLQNGAPDTPPTPNPNTCSAVLSATSFAPGTSGGAFNVNVTVGPTCPWTAGSNSGFITVTNGANGRGNGVVTFSVAANTGGSRTGSLNIAGQTVTVSQSGQSALNIAGTWLETISGSSSSNGSQTVVLTQSSGGAIGGGASVPSPATDVFTGTVSGSSISGLTETFRYRVAQGGTTVDCSAVVRYTIASASNTLLTGTFGSTVSCTVTGPVPVPLPTTTDSGSVRFAKQ